MDDFEKLLIIITVIASGVIIAVSLFARFITLRRARKKGIVYISWDKLSIWNAANKAFKKLDYERALVLYEALINHREFLQLKASHRAVIFLNTAFCKMRTGFLQDAFILIDKANTLAYLDDQTDRITAAYYEHLNLLDESAYAQAEMYGEKAARKNKNNYSWLVNLHLYEMNFEKALAVQEEFICKCNKVQLSKAYLKLITIHKLAGNADGIHSVIERAKRQNLRGFEHIEQELKFLQAEELDYFMKNSCSLADAIKKLTILYKSCPKMVYVIKPLIQKRGFTPMGKRPQEMNDYAFGLNFSSLDEDFKKENDLPQNGGLLLNLNGVNPAIKITNESINNFLNNKYYNLSKRKKYYRLNRYNYQEIENCLNQKIDDIMRYKLINYFVSFFEPNYSYIGIESFKTEDGKDCERIVRIDEGSRLLIFLKRKTATKPKFLIKSKKLKR